MTKNDLGIIAMEIYFPSTYVQQEDLEKYYRASKGKFTIGLGQEKMAFCMDNEDINSMALTVVRRLMEKYAIRYQDIGRLDVGTETIIDKSKSVKSTLMQLFGEHGNHEIVGVDNINACYGGTAALLNSLNWCESSEWDGRYALVVTGDIAVYNTGPARPTGGAGIVAMLLGFNAPLAFDRGISATYMEHAYDFCKPVLSSPYPSVDGRLTIGCYLRALDYCYRNYMDRISQKSLKTIRLQDIDYFLFHTPYCKLIQKSIARLLYLEELHQGLKIETYNEKEYMLKSKPIFQEKTVVSLLGAKNLGNSYCSSLFACILSLINNCSDENLIGKRVVLFAYGSGLASTMYSFVFKQSPQRIAGIVDLGRRLENRVLVSAEEYEAIMKYNEQVVDVSCYIPISNTAVLESGTYYLEMIDQNYRRHYTYKQ